MLCLAATASALSTGYLYGQSCVSDSTDSGDFAGCGAALPTLSSAVDVAVSPDGKAGYAISAGEDAIVRFDRDTTTGALTPQGCISDPNFVLPCGQTAQGLYQASGVAVSPDGTSVYAVSSGDNAIVRFDRNTGTGALTPQGCIADAGDVAGCGTTQQGL